MGNLQTTMSLAGAILRKLIRLIPPTAAFDLFQTPVPHELLNVQDSNLSFRTEVLHSRLPHLRQEDRRHSGISSLRKRFFVQTLRFGRWPSIVSAIGGRIISKSSRSLPTNARHRNRHAVQELVDRAMCTFPSAPSCRAKEYHDRHCRRLRHCRQCRYCMPSSSSLADFLCLSER